MALCPASSVLGHGSLWSVREGAGGQGSWQVVHALGTTWGRRGPGHRWATLLYCLSAVAFLMDLLAKPVAPAAAVLSPALEAGTGALEAGVGAVTHPLFKGFNPLTFILASMGIPVDHLVEGSRKCVAELGPEAVGAVKALLVKGTPGTSLCAYPPGRPPLSPT